MLSTYLHRTWWQLSSQWLVVYGKIFSPCSLIEKPLIESDPAAAARQHGGADNFHRFRCLRARFRCLQSSPLYLEWRGLFFGNNQKNAAGLTSCYFGRRLRWPDAVKKAFRRDGSSWHPKTLFVVFISTACNTHSLVHFPSDVRNTFREEMWWLWMRKRSTAFLIVVVRVPWCLCKCNVTSLPWQLETNTGAWQVTVVTHLMQNI